MIDPVAGPRGRDGGDRTRQRRVGKPAHERAVIALRPVPRVTAAERAVAERTGTVSHEQAKQYGLTPVGSTGWRREIYDSRLDCSRFQSSKVSRVPGFQGSGVLKFNRSGWSSCNVSGRDSSTSQPCERESGTVNSTSSFSAVVPYFSATATRSLPLHVCTRRFLFFSRDAEPRMTRRSP